MACIEPTTITLEKRGSSKAAANGYLPPLQKSLRVTAPPYTMGLTASASVLSGHLTAVSEVNDSTMQQVFILIF